MTPPITPTQRRVLEFVQGFRAQRGFSPTCVKIARNFGWKSENSAFEHLRALRRRSLITHETGIARGIRLTLTGAAVLGEPSALPELPIGRFISLPVVDMAKVNRSELPT